MATIRVRGPVPKKVHGNTKPKPYAGIEAVVIAVDECPAPPELPPCNPVEVRPDNVCEILAVFGMVGRHEGRGQGWHRTFMHVPQPSGIPLSVGRVMFQDGQLSHIKWYINAYGELGPLDYYRLGLTFYIATGVALDAPAWSDLVDRATAAAQAEYDAKTEARRLNPAYDRSGQPKRRRALQPRNPVKHAYRILSEYISDATGKEFAFLYL